MRRSQKGNAQQLAVDITGSSKWLVLGEGFSEEAALENLEVALPRAWKEHSLPGDKVSTKGMAAEKNLV